MEIENNYFFSIYEDFLNSNFELFPDEKRKGITDPVQELRSQLAQFIIYYLNSFSTKSINLSITLNKIILILISYFRKETNIRNDYIKDEKILKILKYIDKNYGQNINMDKIAEINFISASSLSKLFKKETGKLFSKYLNEIRVNRSLMDLLYSSLSIDEIAYKNGFTNSRTYRRRFKEYFGKSPSEYREKSSIGENIKIEDDFNLQFNDSTLTIETLYSFINSKKENISKGNIVETNKKIVLDSTISREQILPNKIIHIGSLEMLFEDSVFSELETIKKDIGLDYIGINSIYNNFPKSYSNDLVDEFYVFSEFGRFDSIIEYLFNNDIGYFYQIELEDFKGKNSNNYFCLIRFLRNLKNLFGEKALNKIQINCIFKINNINQNYNQFKIIYNDLKNIYENIEIGASIPCAYPNYNFNSTGDKEIYVKHIVPLCDFLSFTSEPNKIYDYSKNDIANMDFFNEFVYKETITIRDLVGKWNVNIPIILSEWNTLTGEKQSINGTFFRAAIILQEILKLDLLIKSYGFWINAGIYKNYKLDKNNKYNGLELFHNYSGKKPVYHVLALSSRLKGKVKFLGRECMFLQNSDKYQLLLWNPNYFNPKLSEEIRFMESKSVLYNIEIPNIDNNIYQVKRFDLSRGNGAIYYVYKDFKSKYPIDIEARNYIGNESKPKLSIFDVNIKNGFSYSFVLDTNAIILLEFTPIYYENL